MYEVGVVLGYQHGYQRAVKTWQELWSQRQDWAHLWSSQVGAALHTTGHAEWYRAVSSGSIKPRVFLFVSTILCISSIAGANRQQLEVGSGETTYKEIPIWLFLRLLLQAW